MAKDLSSEEEYEHKFESATAERVINLQLRYNISANAKCQCES